MGCTCSLEVQSVERSPHLAAASLQFCICAPLPSCLPTPISDNLVRIRTYSFLSPSCLHCFSQATTWAVPPKSSWDGLGNT